MKFAVRIIVLIIISCSPHAWGINVSPARPGLGAPVLYVTLTPSNAIVPSSNSGSSIYNKWYLCALLTDASGRLPPRSTHFDCGNFSAVWETYIPGANISRPNATTTVSEIIALTGGGMSGLWYPGAFSDFVSGYTRVCLFTVRDYVLVPISSECASAADIPLPTSCSISAPNSVAFGVLPAGTTHTLNPTVSVLCDTDSRVTLLARSANGSSNLVDLGSGVTAKLYIDGTSGQVGVTKSVVMNATTDFNLGVTLDIPTTATGTLAGNAVLTAQWP